MNIKSLQVTFRPRAASVDLECVVPESGVASKEWW